MKKIMKSNTIITFDMSVKLKLIINFLLISLSQLRELLKMGLTESFTFKADLFTLSKEYFEIIMHIRSTNLFKERTSKLQNLVKEYLKNPKSFDKTNLDLLSVDCSAKLHPHDYANGKIDKEYLINACLRQQQFCRKIHVKCITFEDCEKGYRKFLSVVKNRPGKITVPSLMEDFMWHSHMRDHQNYVKDMKKNLGFVLNHNDQIPKEDLKKYWDDALVKRNKIYGQEFKQYQITSK